MHNRWHRADADQGALLSLNLCPEFFLSRPGMAQLATRAQNVGPVTMGARKLWHVRIRQALFTLDVYVDQRSHYWARFVSEQRGPPQEHAVFVYSRFNEIIAITPPKIGAARP